MCICLAVSGCFNASSVANINLARAPDLLQSVVHTHTHRAPNIVCLVASKLNLGKGSFAPAVAANPRDMGVFVWWVWRSHHSRVHLLHCHKRYKPTSELFAQCVFTRRICCLTVFFCSLSNICFCRISSFPHTRSYTYIPLNTRFAFSLFRWSRVCLVCFSRSTTKLRNARRTQSSSLNLCRRWCWALTINNIVMWATQHNTVRAGI